VHVAKCKQNLASVKHGDIVAEPTIFPQTIEQLASTAVLKHHVDKQIVLKGSLQFVNEGMMKLAEDFLLEFDMFHLFEVDDVGLGDLFQGQYLFAWRQHLLDSSESACSQRC
jgi:hypothetical protein